MQRASGFVEKGVTTISINGVTSAASVQRAYPSSTVTVYAAGTTNLSTIYSDNSSTPKANPFTASADGSWFFYAADGRYDVKFSGGGITTPWTLSDVLLDDAAAAGAPVTSVFGRTGAVTGTSGDYSFAMLSGTASVAQLPVLGGDLSGTVSNATVAKVQGRAVLSTAPSDGQALLWVAGTSAWAPGSPTVASDHSALSNLNYDSAGHTNFVSVSGTQTVYNKTLSIPTIADFTNAAHAHTTASGGGLLTMSAISGTLTAAMGGTGQSSFTKGDILVAASAAALSKLNVGTDGSVLMADSSTTTGVKWAANPSTNHNMLSATHSDTTAGSVARGALLVGGASTWSKLVVGATSGQVLKTDGTDPSWGHAGLWATGTLDFGTAGPQQSLDLTISVTGAQVGDPVALGLPAVTETASCYTAWVSTTGTVTVRLNNYGTSSIGPPSGDFKVVVFK